jgi:hypothetical protein
MVELSPQLLEPAPSSILGSSLNQLSCTRAYDMYTAYNIFESTQQLKINIVLTKTI